MICRWPRRKPAEPALSRDEVADIFLALADIKAWTREILQILTYGDEDEDEEEEMDA